MIRRILSFERQMPLESGVPFTDFIAHARTPEMQLPGYWMISQGEGKFVDTDAQMEAELERLRGEGTLKVYEGPESSCARDDADVEVYSLHVGEELIPHLRRLLDLGVHPDAFTEGPKATFKTVTGDTETVYPAASSASWSMRRWRGEYSDRRRCCARRSRRPDD